jgi:hypothetical protein
MAGAFEQPLFFSTAMITTSSRLQHLDSHFYLHARLSGCRQATSRPRVERIHSSPPLLLSPHVKYVKRSNSRSSTSSDTTSHHTAVSTAEEDAPEEKTTCLRRKDVTAIQLENGQPGVTTTSKAKAQDDTSSQPMACQARIPATEPLKALPDRLHTTNQRESTHRVLDRRRRTSTISEPLPTSSIPRRRSSTVHRRQRKGQDLISFHRDSCRLFQSLEGTLSANRENSRPILSRHYSMPGSPSIPFSKSLDLPEIYRPTVHLENKSEDEVSADAIAEVPEYVASTVSLPVSIEIEEMVSPMRSRGATMISWTTAETRKREYDKIDQAHSGLRGLWKKLTPKWCRGRDSRRKFFEGKCDGDSVRRYRVEVPTRFDSPDGPLQPQKA